MARRHFHDWREWRRFQALRLARRAWKHRDIAEALGITEGSVSQWLSKVQQRGAKSLRSQPHGGHPKLTPEQVGAIQRDEKKIAHWRKEVWPELRQRAHKERRTLVFTDESGFYPLPA